MWIHEQYMPNIYQNTCQCVSSGRKPVRWTEIWYMPLHAPWQIHANTYQNTYHKHTNTGLVQHTCSTRGYILACIVVCMLCICMYCYVWANTYLYWIAEQIQTFQFCAIACFKPRFVLYIILTYQQSWSFPLTILWAENQN